MSRSTSLVLVLPVLQVLLGPLVAQVAASDDRRTQEPAARGHAIVTKALGDRFVGSVLVTRGDERLFQECFGRVDPTADAPIAPDTLFCIGSITKLFTSIAILELEREGRLSVTDRIDAHLDGVPPDKADITLHQLLTHSAGLHPFHDQPGEGGDFAPIAKDEAIARILAQKLLFAPGARSEYSNSGYTLLAAVVEEASGSSFDAFVRAKIFEPAGMQRSGFFGDTDLAAGEFARGHGAKQHGDNSPRSWGAATWSLVGSGGIVSTVGDLRRLVVALRDGRLLDEARRRMLLTAQRSLPEGGAEGYGWMVARTRDGKPLYEVAGGDDFGFHAVLAWIPDGDRFVAITCSSAPREGTLAPVVQELLALAVPTR